MKKYFLILLLFFFAIPVADVLACDIAPFARADLKILYRSFRVDLPKPKLKINYEKLKAVDKAEIRLYGIGASKKKFYLGAYIQKDKIVVYNKIFQKHTKCDKYVKSKLRDILAHEYTHYLDTYGNLSKLINSTNKEQTAIIGEYAFAELIWPNKKMIFTRPLTESEKVKMVKLKDFLKVYKR